MDDEAPRGRRVLWQLLALVAVVLLTVAADQAAKRSVERHLRGRPPIEVLPGFDLRYARNPGAAWGLLADTREAFRRPFFVGVSIAAMAFVLVIFFRAADDQRRLRVALALILGGAAGNFLDRMLHGHVIDFVDWHVRLLGRVRHWPTFNIADAAITIGVLLIALEILPRRVPAGNTGTEGSTPPP